MENLRLAAVLERYYHVSDTGHIDEVIVCDLDLALPWLELPVVDNYSRIASHVAGRSRVDNPAGGT